MVREKKIEKIDSFIKIIKPYLEKSLTSFRKEKKEGISAEELDKILKSLKTCFVNLTSSKLKEDDKIKGIKEFLLLIYNLDLENQIEDAILRRTARTVKRDLIQRRNREKLAEYIAELLYNDWRRLSLTEQKKIVSYLHKKVQKQNYVYKILLNIFLLLAPYTLARLNPDEFNNFLNLIIKLLKDVEEKKDLESTLLKVNRYLLERLNIIKIMRKSFTGLLLSDFLLISLGKSLGLKQRFTLTDFIIFLSVKIQEKEIFNRLNLQEVKRIKKSLQELI